MNEVLVIAVHPDDETLGCGGTLLKHKAQGDHIHWLIATEITLSKQFSQDKIDQRVETIKSVAAQYDFTSTHQLPFTTMEVDQYHLTDLISKIAIVIEKVQPNIVYLPFKHDIHSDHRIIFDAAFSCLKSFRQSSINSIYMMETLSETEFAPSLAETSFIPNVFVNISEYFQQKIDILKYYQDELGEHPFPRSVNNIEALATYRGAMSRCQYAESFMLLKEIK